MMRDGIFVGGIYTKDDSRCNTFAWSNFWRKYYYIRTRHTVEDVYGSTDQGTGTMAPVSPAILAFWS